MCKEEKLNQIIAMLFQNMSQYDAKETLKLVDEFVNLSIYPLPSDEEIEIEANSYDNSLSSISEGVWMPEGFKKGAKWMRNKAQTRI